MKVLTKQNFQKTTRNQDFKILLKWLTTERKGKSDKMEPGV